MITLEKRTILPYISSETDNLLILPPRQPLTLFEEDEKNTADLTRIVADLSSFEQVPLSVLGRIPDFTCGDNQTPMGKNGHFLQVRLFETDMQDAPSDMKRLAATLSAYGEYTEPMDLRLITSQIDRPRLQLAITPAYVDNNTLGVTLDLTHFRHKVSDSRELLPDAYPRTHRPQTDRAYKLQNRIASWQRNTDGVHMLVSAGEWMKEAAEKKIRNAQQSSYHSSPS